MAYTTNDLTDAVKALRDSDAINPILCKEGDGFCVTSSLNISDYDMVTVALAEREHLEGWCDKLAEDITDEDCEEFAKNLAKTI